MLHHFFYFKTTPYIDRDCIKSLVKIGGVVLEKKPELQTEKWTIAYYNIDMHILTYLYCIKTKDVVGST